MQKGFYYKLFKRLGLFPQGTFTDNVQTITFPSGSGGGGVAILSGSSNNSTNNRYFHPNCGMIAVAGNATDPTNPANNSCRYAFVASRPLILQNFIVNCDTPGAGKSLIMTIVRNTVETTLVVTVADTNSQASNAVNTVTLAKGDLVAVKYAVTGGASILNYSWTVEAVPIP